MTDESEPISTLRLLFTYAKFVPAKVVVPVTFNEPTIVVLLVIVVYVLCILILSVGTPASTIEILNWSSPASLDN